MKIDSSGIDVHERLQKWAEVTALSLRLLEASIQKEFPDLSPDEIHIKLIERLHASRRLKFSLE